jgi:RNA polymerase subunit RPABC4/transcription elongation factor Spt4
MFCPRCATQNSDDTKFCRACGTNLATVNLVLSDPQQLSAADKLAGISAAKRRAGISNLIHGTGWTGASTIVGVALGVFSNTNDWIFVWLGLASWMACWGMIQWSQGISKLVEARSLKAEHGLMSEETTWRELTRKEPTALPDAPTTTKLAEPTSVTENTTELLHEKRPDAY